MPSSAIISAHGSTPALTESAHVAARRLKLSDADTEVLVDRKAREDAHFGHVGHATADSFVGAPGRDVVGVEVDGTTPGGAPHDLAAPGRQLGADLLRPARHFPPRPAIYFLGLIALGLFTRPAAFLASGEMAFAYFTVHFPHGFWPINNHGEDSVMFCFAFLLLVFTGGGPYALEARRSGSQRRIRLRR